MSRSMMTVQWHSEALEKNIPSDGACLLQQSTKKGNPPTIADKKGTTGTVDQRRLCNGNLKLTENRKKMALRYQICRNFPFLSIESSGNAGVLSRVFEVSRENTEAELLVEGLLLDVFVAGVCELNGV